MRYHEAFDTIIKRYGIKILSNRFLFFSCVSDLLGNSKTDLVLLDIYYALNKDVLIYDEIKNKTLVEAKNYVKALVSTTDRRYMIEQYIRSVEPMFVMLFPNEYQLYKGGTGNKVVNVVKAPRKPGASLTPHRHVPAKPNVINKAAQKTNNPPYVINTINVDARCRQFTIKFTNKKKYRLIDDDGLIVNSGNTFVISNDVLNINVNDKKNRFTLEVPHKRYQSLNASFEGTMFMIDGADLKKVYFNDVNINAKAYETTILVNVNTINANISKGNFWGIGEFKKINIQGTNSDVNIVNYGRIAKEYNISTNDGDITLNFPNGKVLPKINHMFKPVSNISGDYIYCQGLLKLNLVTNNGKIKVKS